MKIRILYPTATQAQGIKGEGGDTADVEASLAEAMVAAGFAEAVEPKTKSAPAAKRTTTKK